jgi:hypothetical protein
VKLTRSATFAAAVAAALVAAAPAAAAPTGDRPTAKAAGGDAPPVIPALIQTRITRVNNAIDRLTDYVDDNDVAGVDRTGKVIRRQLAAAWRGAVYYIKNPPPPVGDDARAKASVLDDEGPVLADQFTTAAAVYEAQHDVASSIAALTDGARVPILNTMSRTLFWTLDARDKAIATTHALDVPPAEGEEGGEDAVSFGTVMPGTIMGLDDEIRQIQGLKSDAKDLRPGGTKILNSAMAQTLLTELQINTYWPPVTED